MWYRCDRGGIFVRQSKTRFPSKGIRGMPRPDYVRVMPSGVVVTGCTVRWIGSAIDKEHSQVMRPQSAKTSTNRGLAQRKKAANAGKAKKG